MKGGFVLSDNLSEFTNLAWESDFPITFLRRQSSSISQSSLIWMVLFISLSGRSNVENGKIDSFERRRPDKTSQYWSPLHPPHSQRWADEQKPCIEIFWLKIWTIFKTEGIYLQPYKTYQTRIFFSYLCFRLKWLRIVKQNILVK